MAHLTNTLGKNYTFPGSFRQINGKSPKYMKLSGFRVPNQMGWVQVHKFGNFSKQKRFFLGGASLT